MRKVPEVPKDSILANGGADQTIRIVDSISQRATKTKMP